MNHVMFRFVVRIFDDGETFYGLLHSYSKSTFLVVYDDGDSQRLSVNQVDEEGVRGSKCVCVCVCVCLCMCV
jgi:hypothetical protein